ncbi:MAG: sigma 54-interacting transcriptional regulator [Cellvibrionaceae bacterium]|nr:sigma 54-interacting transcriptional regulator [Cellvibrionaceae bacterium]
MTESTSSNKAIGEHPLFLSALDHASQLAALPRPVLVLGERGSGKELVAQRMHFLAPRWGEPFLKINCAALTESLVESTLFGHEAGAFTGANRSQSGLFERAEQGTLFLDEIATLSLRVQEKLLRVLEYGEYQRVGGQKTLISGARVVGATHVDLRTFANEGRFRDDLLDRLAFDVVHMPPLRMRGEDVLLLANHFALGFAVQLGWEYFHGFSRLARQQLLSYPWPGNVRELKNVIERSLFRSGQPDAELQQMVLNPFDPPWQASSQADASQFNNDVPASDQPVDFKALRLAWEREQVERALSVCQHHQGKAAAWLGLSYDQLRALLKRLELPK